MPQLVVERETDTCSVAALEQPPVDLTLDDPAAAAAAGDLRAADQVLAQVRPFVLRYCRARLGNRETPTRSADDVAQEVCLALARAARILGHARAPGRVDALPAEVVVLRLAVGLSAKETALVVGSSPQAVRVTQHRALTRLRALAVAGR